MKIAHSYRPVFSTFCQRLMTRSTASIYLCISARFFVVVPNLCREYVNVAVTQERIEAGTESGNWIDKWNPEDE